MRISAISGSHARRTHKITYYNRQSIFLCRCRCRCYLIFETLHFANAQRRSGGFCVPHLIHRVCARTENRRGEQMHANRVMHSSASTISLKLKNEPQHFIVSFGFRLPFAAIERSFVPTMKYSKSLPKLINRLPTPF